MMEPYYYNHMTKMHQTAYHALWQGLSDLRSSIEIPLLENQEYADLFFKLRLDHPEIFYAESFKYRFYPEGSTATLTPVYLFDKNKIRQHQQALQARIDRLIRPMLQLSDWEKEKQIHDFICEHVRYDKLKKQYSHEIIGPLTQGVGVCEGIAKTVKSLCDALGIWCIVVISEANPEKKIKYRHAWNILRIGGQYYHLDTTFDNSMSHEDEIRYDYFNLDDERIFRDHEPMIERAPVCSDGDFFYYKETKLSFTKLEQVTSRALQAAKKGKTLTFHWRGGALNRTLVEEILGMIREAAQKKEKSARVRLNLSQAVFSVTFEQNAELEEVELENFEDVE